MKTYEIFSSSDLHQIKDDVAKFAQAGYELKQLFTFGDEIVGVVEKRISQKSHAGEKLVNEAVNNFTPKCLEKVEYWADVFVKHRRKIKKTIKTARPIIAFLKEIDDLCVDGYDVADAVETMKNCEWQTLKYEYVANKQKDGDAKPSFI